jgi:hypothetical protein
MKPGFIPKSAKTYPLSPKETDAVKAFLDEHIAKDFIQPSKSLQASGYQNRGIPKNMCITSS